jgi:uncharacterized protein (TIGR03437 family)
MAFKHVLSCVLLLAAFLMPAEAQRLVVVPSGAASGIEGFLNVEPFGPGDSISGDVGAFLALGKPDGSIYFVVSPTKIVVVGPDGARTQTPLPIADELVSAAALSTDGTRLVVASGTSSSGHLHVFDTSAAAPAELGSAIIGDSPFDVAISQDSTTAYVIGSEGIQAVDLGSLTVGTPVSVTGAQLQSGAHPGIAIAPNGLIYVNAVNAVQEIHPVTLATLHSIPVTGYPGRPSISLDSTAAVVANQLASNPQATVLDLSTHAATSALTGVQTMFNNVAYVDANRIYATSSTASQLFVFSASNPQLIQEASFPGVGKLTHVVAMAVSNEFPALKYLFVVTTSAAYRIDLTTPNTTPATSTLSSSAGQPFYLGENKTGLAPVNTQQFNATQSLALGEKSLPLVVRLSDANGIPIANQAVVWAPQGATLQNPMTVTNRDGFATASVSSDTAGTYAVQASFPQTTLAAKTFTITVGGGGGGEEPPPPPASGVAILSGNGLVTRGGQLAPEPMVVIVRDGNGNPKAGVPVMWTLNGIGSLLPNYIDAGQAAFCTVPVTGTVSCVTDGNGLSSTNFSGGSVPNSGTSSFRQSNITASVPAQGTVPAGSVQFVETSIPVTAGSDNHLGPPPMVTMIQPQIGNLNITGNAGQTLTGAFQVKVTAVNPIAQLVPNVGLYFRAGQQYALGGSNPAASCAGGIVLTNASGVATCDLVLGNTPGTYRIYRVVGGYDTLAYSLTINEAPPPPKVPTTITKSNDGQTGGPGATLPARLIGTVKDQFGAVMPNLDVTWAVISGKATFLTPSAKTDSTGKASAGVKLGTTPGDVKIRLTVGSISATFTVHISNPVTAIAKAGGDGQTANTGATFALPLTVLVSTAQGPAPNQTVTFTVSGPGTLTGGPDLTTGSDGKASITVVAGSTAGTVQVTASISGMSVTFTLTVRLPGPELEIGSFLNGASFQPGFAFGSIVAIRAPGLTFGLNLAPGACLNGTTMAGPIPVGSLPTRVAGVEFQFGNLLAPIISICTGLDGTEQALVQAPFELAPYTTGVTARYGAGTGIVTTFGVGDVPVRNAMPGIFEFNGVALATLPDGTYVSADRPAHPGDEISVQVTGLGPVLPGVQTNVPGLPGQRPYFMPIVSLNGAGVAGVTAEYSRNLIGVFTVTFQIPSDAATGSAVPLEIDVRTDNGTIVTGSVSHIPIEP